MVERVISGGQTGVDRAALDVALELGIPVGGWCPRGRLAEDGRIDSRYPLEETKSPKYAVRTRLNVRDSDGTLILAMGELTGGTAVTRNFAREAGKPWLVVDPSAADSIHDVINWLRQHDIRTLNVAGPRSSQQPGIYEQAVRFLRELLNAVRRDDDCEVM